jgi:hypothetical protein
MVASANELASNDFSEAELQKISPGRLLAHIQKLFKKWGIYKQKLTLRHEGDEYAFSCHEEAFVVYRLLPRAAMPSPASGRFLSHSSLADNLE